MRIEPLEDRRLLALIVPLLNSREYWEHTIFLDFDGDGAFTWNGQDASPPHGDRQYSVPATPAFNLDTNAADFSNAELTAIREIWAYVADRFSPFDVNVTTIDPGPLQDNRSIRVLIGGGNAWLGAGGGITGIAAIGAYANNARDNTCFAFSAQMADTDGALSATERHAIAETIAHEAGHVFGLTHQRATVGGTVIEYYDGDARRVPIMGDGDEEPNKRSIWWTTNMANAQQSPDLITNEIDVLQRTIGIADDDLAFSRELQFDHMTGELVGEARGVIERLFDVDRYFFNTNSPSATITVTGSYTVEDPVNLTSTRFGGMLRARVRLIDGQTGAVVVDQVGSDTTLSTVSIATSALVPGRAYWLEIASGDRGNDLGQYEITGDVGSFASIDGNVLTLTGFADIDNTFKIFYNAPHSRYEVDYYGRGGNIFEFFRGNLSQINVVTNGSNDAVHILGLFPDIPVNIIANEGIDSVTIDDRTPGGSIESVDVYIDRLSRNTPSGRRTVNFTDISSLTYYAAPQSAIVNVYSTSAWFPETQQVTIVGSGADDTIRVVPHDAFGHRTLHGNLGVIGGDGVDRVIIDDAAAGPLAYLDLYFRNHFGPDTTSIFGVGTKAVSAASDVENIIVNAGKGHDTFNIDSFKAGSGLTINGGWGNDRVNFGSINVTSEITNMSSFHFDGQEGGDLLRFNNSGSTTGFNYYRNVGVTNVTSPAGLHYAFGDANLEAFELVAGSGADLLRLEGTDPDFRTIFHGLAGVDSLVLGRDFALLERIRGQVVYYAGQHGGTVTVLDGLDATGDTVHLTRSSLGAHPGDNLFGPGGSLVFFDVASANGIDPAIALNLSRGADSIFVEPHPTAKILILGNDPTTTPGDTLRLSLLDITDPVLTPNGPGAGTYSFGNAADVVYTGFETASAYMPGDYDDDGVVGPGDNGLWRENFGMAVPAGTSGDGNGDGVVNAADFVVWRNNLGATRPVVGFGQVDDDAIVAAAHPIAQYSTSREVRRSVATARRSPLRSVDGQADDVAPMESLAIDRALEQIASESRTVAHLRRAHSFVNSRSGRLPIDRLHGISDVALAVEDVAVLQQLATNH